MSHLQRKRGFGWLYGLLLRGKITPIGKKLAARVVEHGWTLGGGLRGLCLRRGRREIWFDPSDAGWLWFSLPNFSVFEQQLIFEEKNGREVSDCRGHKLRRYRTLNLPDFVWLPELPEATDVTTGYFARGRPIAGATVFDAGAYCGATTIALARTVGPQGRVFAFEPDTKNRALLTRNVSETGLNNITIIPRGLWRRTTELAFMAEGNLASHVTEDATEKTECRVPVVSFEDACQLAEAVPSFVKMDIEGAEVETVEGNLEFIARERIRFSIASYHDRGGQPTSTILEPLFTRIGYHVETGYPTHRTTWAWRD